MRTAALIADRVYLCMLQSLEKNASTPEIATKILWCFLLVYREHAISCQKLERAKEIRDTRSQRAKSELLNLA